MLKKYSNYTLIAPIAFVVIGLVFASWSVNDSLTENSTLKGSLNGHEWVDLGLPSGTLWATCNIGSDVPEGHGYCYAWGETEVKKTFNRENYKFYNTVKDGYNHYTKYNVFVDKLNVLKDKDDAATVNWGKGWRMPTFDEFFELNNLCEHKWMEINHVEGCLYVGPNGNSVFLPIAGKYTEKGFEYDGAKGKYWSSSVCPFVYYENYSWLFVNGSYLDYCFNPRYFGLPIRPVCSRKYIK